MADVTRSRTSDDDQRIEERADNSTQVSCSGENDTLNQVLGDAAEWDINWEDLQIGERIGIGKNLIDPFFQYFSGK